MFESSEEVFSGLRDASYDIDEEYYFLNVDDIPLTGQMFHAEPEATTSAELPKNKEEEINPKKKTKRGSRKKSTQSKTSSSQPINITWRNYNWQCLYCDLHFQTVSELKIHGIEVHECCNPYKCTDCNIRKVKLDCFITHVTRHKKYLKLSCCICYEKFSEVSEAKNHYKIHFQNKYACSGCNESFENFDELDQHNLTYKRDIQIKRSRANLNENMQCHVCKKTFKHKRTLSSHLLTHTGKKQQHKCERCGKTYVTKQGLNVHLMAHDNIKPHNCVICNLNFRTYGQLKVHVGVHTDIKPFECEICNKRFRLSKQLANHHIVHTDIYPYSCPFCDKTFRFKTFISEHIRQHTGVKPYYCSTCEKKYASWANYNKHMKQLHDITVAKRQWTLKGICPIDPITGKVIIWEETDENIQWKNEVLNGVRKPGRPKTKR